MSKVKTIAAFVGLVAVITLWRIYAPGAWFTVFNAIGSLFNNIAQI